MLTRESHLGNGCVDDALVAVLLPQALRHLSEGHFLKNIKKYLIATSC